MNIWVVTGHTQSDDEAKYRQWCELAEATNPSKEAYAKQHGYRFYYSRHEPQENGAYCKLDIILRSFEQGADIVFWSDTDARITNTDITIESLIDTPAGITLTADILGTNTGVMILQNCPRVRDFLWACNTYGKAWHGVGGWAEQTSIREFMKTPPYNEPGFIRHLPQRVMNSYTYYCDGRSNDDKAIWQDGDFMLHLPGMGHEKRMELFKRFDDIDKEQNNGNEEGHGI